MDAPMASSHHSYLEGGVNSSSLESGMACTNEGVGVVVFVNVLVIF